MPVPLPFRQSALLLATALVLSGLPAHARPDPPVRISLESLGYRVLPDNVIAAGGAMSTLNFAGDHHLLITFAVRELMRRTPDSRPEDDDGTIEAVLYDLHAARVVARTRWRIHDRDPYLWNLGSGTFLLRSRDRLFAIDPLANLARPDPFLPHPFLQAQRRIEAILLSANNDLLTLETIDHVPVPERSPSSASSRPAFVAGPPAPPPPHPSSLVHIQFFRLLRGPEGVRPSPAGALLSKSPLALPVTAEGVLNEVKEKRDTWDFDFNPFGGKPMELAPFDSTCPPRAHFVSSTEFIAFGCRGGRDRLSVAGFNFAGEEMWEQTFLDFHVFTYLSAAPAAGRFALARLIGDSILTPETYSPSVGRAEEIRVVQAYSGKVLFQANSIPIQIGGQDFSLSPDGLQLAALRNRAIEINQLPPLTHADLLAITLARTRRPPRTSAPIELRLANAPPAPDATPDATPDAVPDAITEVNPTPNPEAVPVTAPEATPPAASEAAPTLTSVPAPTLNSAPAAPAPTPESVQTAAPASTPSDQPPTPRKPPSLYDPDHPAPPK